MFITLCVIAYNEEKTLPKILGDICSQEYDHSQIEVVLVDGASTDGTKQVMQEFAQRMTGSHSEETAGDENHANGFRDVRILDNPGRTLPCGWNVALADYKGEAILKIDAHARIPADFVTKNVQVLASGEDIAGGYRPNVIDTKDGREPSGWQETLLLAESSMFGSSIAPYRRNQGRKYVNSMFHAAYRREVFDRVGGFNERLGRTEDNEIHYRMREAGFKLCFDPEIISYQHIRSSLKSMLKQKYANGYWIARTTPICPKCLSLYHFVPFVFVMAILLSTVCCAGFAAAGATFLFARVVYGLTALMWGLYWVLAILMAVAAVIGAEPKQRHISNLLLPGLFFLLHVSYGVGTVAGFFKVLVL